MLSWENFVTLNWNVCNLFLVYHRKLRHKRYIFKTTSDIQSKNLYISLIWSGYSHSKKTDSQIFPLISRMIIMEKLWTTFLNPFQVSDLFLNSLKTSENQRFWKGFQWVWKWSIDLKWLKQIGKAMLRHPPII